MRKRFRRQVLVGLATSLSLMASVVAAQNCRVVQPIGPPPHSAEDYPLPLSLRVNLIRLMKREMAAIGRYNDPDTVDDGVFHILLENQIRRLQAERGEAETGCITWDLVTMLDRSGRRPPPEAVEAFE